jgi:hypothetical protein
MTGPYSSLRRRVILFRGWGNPGILQAPFPCFPGFYRIVTPKCRIVRRFQACSDMCFTSESAGFFMGEYRTVPMNDSSLQVLWRRIRKKRPVSGGPYVGRVIFHISETEHSGNSPGIKYPTKKCACDRAAWPGIFRVGLRPNIFQSKSCKNFSISV